MWGSVVAAKEGDRRQFLVGSLFGKLVTVEFSKERLGSISPSPLLPGPKKAERKISTFQVFLFRLPNNPKHLNVSELELPPNPLRIQIADPRR